MIFPQGTRINPVEATFTLEGNEGEYPFDHHEALLWLRLSTPAPVESRAATAAGSGGAPATRAAGQPAAGPAGGSSQPVPIVFDYSASVSGFRFAGDIARGDEGEGAQVEMTVTRSLTVKVVALIVMSMMAALAASVLVMTLKATRPDRELDIVPLSLAATLIFGLPRLRDIQPGIPPVGTFGDYVSFIWAELVLAFSAVVVVWTWILRPRKTAKGDSSRR